VTRQQIVHAAREYVGVPFQHQGRSKNGIDCGGLVILVGKKLGTLPADWDCIPYPKEPKSEWMRDILNKFWNRCDPELKPGRIVFMSFPGDPTHLGVVSEYNGTPYIIHATSRDNRVVQHRLDSVWKRSIRMAFEYPGVED
jgi:cell wall-associated NlpC family hydrolase